MAGYKRKKKGSFVDRLIMGKEKSEGYARASLPSNRWELFFDILKGRFGKLIFVNLMVGVFFIPLIMLCVYRYMYAVNLGVQYPFSQGFGIGYQAVITLVGLKESIAFNANLFTFLFMPVAMIIAAVGLSGGAYIMRNMVWTEGVFVASDFWKGVKQNFKQVCLICCIFAVVFYLSILAISFMDIYLVSASKLKWIFTIAKIVCWVVLVSYSIISLHMITMSVTYDCKFGKLLKNSLYTTFALLVSNLFFVAVSALPFVFLLLGSFFKTIAIVVICLIAFSFFLLVWTNYCQWIYDRYINDGVKGAKKNRGIYAKPSGENNAKDLRKVKEQMEMAALSNLSSKPIKPITDEELTLAELPQSFNRSDIEKLNESRRILYEDNEKYIQEHLSDERYAKLNQTKEDLMASELERQKRIEQARKELAKRSKNKR